MTFDVIRARRLAETSGDGRSLAHKLKLACDEIEALRGRLAGAEAALSRDEELEAPYWKARAEEAEERLAEEAPK